MTKEDLAKVQEFMDVSDQILNFQKSLIEDKENSLSAIRDLETESQILLKDMQEFIKEKESKNIFLSEEGESIFEYIQENIKSFNKNKETFFPEFFPSPSKQSKSNEDSSILIRAEEDIRKNIKSVADYATNIPREHLLAYMNNIIKNKEFKDITENTQNKNNIILKNPVLNNDINTEKNLNKIYDKIFSSIDQNVRKKLDDSLAEKLINNKQLEQLLKNNEVNEANLIKMGTIIQKLKGEVYRDILGENYSEIKIKIISDPSSNSNLLGGNDKKNLYIYLKENQNIKDYFTTMVHELTHQDQNNISNSNNPEVSDLKKLFIINGAPGGYIKHDEIEYKLQPLEKEAYAAESTVADKVLENSKIKNSQKEKPEDNMNDYSNNGLDLPPVDYEQSDIESDFGDDFSSFVKSSFNKEKPEDNMNDYSNNGLDLPPVDYEQSDIESDFGDDFSSFVKSSFNKEKYEDNMNDYSNNGLDLPPVDYEQKKN